MSVKYGIRFEERDSWSGLDVWKKWYPNKEARDIVYNKRLNDDYNKRKRGNVPECYTNLYKIKKTKND